MILDAFIADHMRKPWQPGSVDCLLALADWAVWRGYPDPAAHLRGTYDTEDGFRAVIATAGGVVPIVQGCADFLGVGRIDVPKVGDAAVIGSRKNEQRQFGAIFDGKGWRVRFADSYPSVTAGHLGPIAVWSL